jgi:hypothetical protein
MGATTDLASMPARPPAIKFRISLGNDWMVESSSVVVVADGDGEGEAAVDEDGGTGSALWPSLPLLVDDDMVPKALAWCW